MATAYASLLCVLNDLEAIKNNPYHYFSFEDKQIQSLGESVDFLIKFMESNDNYHGAGKEAARVLETAIARAALAAEDVLESHVVDQIHAGSTKHGKRTPRFLMDLQRVIDGMEFVKRKAMKVVKMRSGLMNTYTEMQPTYIPAATSSSSSSTSESYTMVGFDDVLLQLLDELTGEASNLQIIPITGMGGIGKTTLAKNAFKHPLIGQRFDVCCWATISQQYVVGDVLSKLLYDRGNSNGETVHELGEQLRKRLFGRRYLIVLDDMWNGEIWEEIKIFFPDRSNRSRIVVTSRSTDVADCLGWPCFPMRFLDESRSWDLFCQKAFAGQRCPRVLEDAGKKIVAKCGGLPLLLVVVGGHLGKSPRTQENWENVAEHMMVTVYDSGENEQLRVFDILSLSYNYLPVHLKPCFLYMGTIPEDDEFDMADIIKLWIAEGFVKKNEAAGESLEMIAEGYFKDLVERNLVLVDELLMKILDGKFISCRIHDVIRELGLKIAKKEQFLDMLDAPRAIDSEERRVVISQKNREDSEIFDSRRSAPLVRSLTWLEGKLSHDLKLLRVVKARSVNLRNKGRFPSANLRYLECSIQGGAYDGPPPPYILLPPLCLFWNLHTLIFTVGFRPVVFPYEIWDMVHLRHVSSYHILLPDPLYRDRSHQLNLQTLRYVHNFRMIEEVCEIIPSVKELWLSYENLERETSYFCPQNLSSFRELESLDCRFGDDTHTICHGFALSLAFPSSLKQLTLSKSRLDWDELTRMAGSLPFLQVLELVSDAVIGSKWTPVEDTFLRLTNFTISYCDDLVSLNADSSHFPRLRTLYLFGLAKMDELPLEIGELPSLELLFLEECKLSLAISAFRILEDQEDQGNDSLKLDVTFMEDDEENRFKEEVGEAGLARKNLYIRHD